MNRVLNLDCKPVSKNNAKVDCLNVFLSEKTKLKSILANLLAKKNIS